MTTPLPDGARRVEIGPPEPAQRSVVIAPRRLLPLAELRTSDGRDDDEQPVGVANEQQLCDLGDVLRAPPSEGSMVPIGPPGPPQLFVVQVPLDGDRALVTITDDGRDAAIISKGVTDDQAHELGEACAAVAGWLHEHGPARR